MDTKKGIFEKEITRDHLDMMGHVNHATYLNILEEARWDLYQRFGYTRADIETDRKGPIVLEANVKYRKEIRPGERVRIETETVKYHGALAEVEQRILNQEGKVSCKAHFVCGYFDLERRKLLKPAGRWYQIHRDLIEA